jgi:hypothetical protein
MQERSLLTLVVCVRVDRWINRIGMLWHSGGSSHQFPCRVPARTKAGDSFIVGAVH